MADYFYADMRAFAFEILAPTSRGGLGQTQVTIYRRALAAVDPEAPWEQPDGYRINQSVTVDAAVDPNENTLLDGTVVSTDEMIITTPAIDSIPLELGSDGCSYYVSSSDGSFTEEPVAKIVRIPPVGTLVCLQFVIKGPGKTET